MSGAQTFQDILNEKMQVSEGELQTEPVRVSCETFASTIAFESFSLHLHDTLESSVFEISGAAALKKTPYAQAKKTVFQASTPRENTKSARPERTKLRSQLSAVEATALEVFVKFGASEFAIAEIIGESKMKKAYRRLAVDLHPDRNSSANSARAFGELHEAYAILARLFKS